jgi:hypothetical protein
MVPCLVQWILFLVGAGGAVVAGSTALTLGLCALLSGRGLDLRWSARRDLLACLRQATGITLVALGAGLAMGVWWAWQVTGRLTAGDPREGWLVVGWVLAATSWVAWRLGRQGGRWAAVLIMLAASVAMTGLLIV